MRHAGSAASFYEVRRGADGVLVMTARNTRFEPFTRYGDRGQPAPRVATVTTEVTQRSDAEGTPGRISVVVEDLSAAVARRVAAFSDPGSEGVLLGWRHFVTTEFGCCAAPNVRRVRLLENGRLLFRATGPGPAGTVAWMEAPNARPRLTRWAAYDGALDQAAYRRGAIGVLAYGSEAETIQRLEVRYREQPEHDAMDLNLGHGGRLVWVQPEHAPEAGRAETPFPIWGLDGGRPSAEIGGFSLRLLDGDGTLAVEIPVEGDRLVVGRATLGAGFSLEALGLDR
ncbi:hypothetical protein [Muricoccus radiodurans]|uniref:hypothetical protein n=1 Tax=Muricoccus radiodurans TaxID=2231721 RepID=UPI003CF1F026